MISLYNGTPGSGKSLHLASVIRDYVKYKNKWVVTNVPINVGNIKGRKRGKYIYLDDIEMTPDSLQSISNSYFSDKPLKEGCILLIIDECQLMFNAREWNKPGRSDWLKFFTLHRHLGYDIILVCQFDQMIDKQIRSLVEYQFQHRKLLNMGWRGYILFFISFGRRFCVVKYWYPMKDKISTQLLYCNKSLFKLYDTYMLFDDSLKEEDSASAPPKEEVDSPVPSEQELNSEEVKSSKKNAVNVLVLRKLLRRSKRYALDIYSILKRFMIKIYLMFGT